jgi:CDP-diacylglycerol--glycerol-3-phosphate 3-phosphatidyltransferase
MNLPNAITMIRFLLAPVFLFLFVGSGVEAVLDGVLEESTVFLLCFVIVAVAEVSDLLDGFFARRWGQVSNLGKVLDPYADSTFHLTCYFAIASGAHGRWVPLWVVLFLFYREVLVEVLRKLGATRGLFIAAAISGKMKTFTQAAVVLIALALAFAKSFPGGPPGGRIPGDLGDIVTPLAWVAVAVTVASGLDYAWRHRALLRRDGKTSDVGT